MEIEELVKKMHRDMLLELQSKFDKSTGSWAHDILEPPARELAKLNRSIEIMDESRDIFNKSGEELDIFISQITPLRRTNATSAVAKVKFTGKKGRVVPSGTLVGSVSHDYRTIKSVTIDSSGFAETEVEAVIKGSGANTEVGQINRFPIIISGVETVTNIEPATGGYDVEKDDTFRKRYFDYIKRPITSGNIYHYMLWAGEIDGVGAVKIHPLWDGDNTVKLVVIDSNGEPADGELINKIQEHIDPKGEKLEDGTYTKWGQGYGEAPLGAFCTIVPANEVSVGVEVDVTLSTGTSVEAVINEFKQLMSERFSSFALSGEESVVSIAQVGAIILGIQGVEDYDINTLKINGQTSNIKLGDEDVAVFGDVIFNEV